MDKEPLISVIIPVYKVERYIEGTVVSLLRQTTDNFEIILVDDGSPDRSIAIAEKRIKETGRDYSVIRQENRGVGSARNAGYRAAGGKWIYFLDSDDVIQPFTFESFEKHASQFENADMVFSKFQYVNEGDAFKPAKKSDAFTRHSREEMLHGFLVRSIVPLVPGTFYRRAFLDENEIEHESIRWSEDQHFMWNVLSRVECAIEWDCVTYNYLRHEFSIMSSTDTNTMEEAYASFRRLSSSIADEEVRRFMLPRWVFGCLHEVSRRHSYPSWLQFSNALEAKAHLKTLLSFPSARMRTVAFIGVVSMRLLYLTLRTER